MKKQEKSGTFHTKQVGGNHYKLPIQPVHFIVQNNLTYLQGNVIKYIVRYNLKYSSRAKRLEDLEKAKHYIQLMIENLED